MGYEVEIKFRVDDPVALRRRIEAEGGVLGPILTQEDRYLAHPARDFARTDEAFRIRRIGPENRVTYKGPKQGGPTKTREEIEVSLEPGDDAVAKMSTLLDRLGFRPVTTITKTRSTYEMFGPDGRRVEVAFDEAEGLGSFAEVEAIAATREDLAAAQRAVTMAADRLGLVDVEPRSYLRMTLEAARLGNSAGPT